jgi:proteasome activator subunit 4
VHSILQYKSDENCSKENKLKWTIPKTDNGHPSIDQVYIHKIHYGFAGLPTKLKCKIPVKDFLDTTTNQSSSRQIVLETSMKYFTDEAYMKNLLEIWTLEEKGKSKANKKAAICRAIARSCGPQALKIILKEIHALGTDTDQWKQRCAADVICGIIFGMKLWDEKTIEEFWTELKPVFGSCLDSVTQETLAVWSTALSYPTVSCWSRLVNALKS